MNSSKSSSYKHIITSSDFIVSIGAMGYSYNQLQNNNAIMSLAVGVMAVTFGLMGLTELSQPTNPDN